VPERAAPTIKTPLFFTAPNLKGDIFSIKTKI